MKKILLLNPPLFFKNQEPQSLDVSVPPLGLLYLASYINKNSKDFKAQIIDIGNKNFSLDQINKTIKRTRPFIVGITSMTPQLQGTVELAQSIKSHFPKLKIVLGGPHISADPDFINRFPNLFDYAITGEGEITFLETLNKLRDNEPVNKIQSSNPPKNLDDIPIPDKSLINRLNYKEEESMLYSRGCPFHCYYCSRPSISNIVRYRSVENLIEEIKACLPFCKGKINFQDDTFTMNKAKVVAFCDEVIKQKLNLKWECNTRIDLVDFELLGLMKNAGCSQINFGIESANEKIRKTIINKGNFSNKDIKQVFSWCKKLRIKIACYFMMGHPTETKKNIEETKKMILNSKIDVLGLSIPLPFPGSPLYEIAQKENIISKELIDKFALKQLGIGYNGIYPLYTPKSLSKVYLLSQMKLINRKFYLNFSTLFSRLKTDIFSIKKLKSDANDFISLIIKGMSSRKPYSKK